MDNTRQPHIHKNETVQVFRGLAIIAVVIIHMVPWAEESLVFCRPFVNFAVPMFLFLSGYLTHPKDNWLPICKKRVLRVLIPYVIWSVIYCIPDICKGGILRFILELLTAQTCYPFYYIAVYIQFVILTPWLFRLAKSKYRILGWLVTPVYVIIKVYFVRLSIIPTHYYLSVVLSDLCFGWFCFYYLGLILGNKLFDNHKNSILRKLAAIGSSKADSGKVQISLTTLFIIYFISLVPQMLEISFWWRLGIGNCGSQANLTALLSSMILCIIAYRIISQNAASNQHSWINRILVPIGNYSFGIYLCHVLIINTYRALMPVSIYDTIPFLISSMVVLMISFMLCYLLSRVLGPKYSHIVGLE